MLNSVILIGRLTRKPDLRYTGSGVAVTSFSLAVPRPFRNAEGEQEVDFVDIATWRQLAETCAEHLDKGRLVAVAGRLQIRSYEGQDGTRRKAAEVIAHTVRFLDHPKRPGADAGADDPFGEVQPAPADPAGRAADEEDVPF